ncbi:hypothetical protein GGR56DRAFT_525582 [Xylariaceae sp. FL0804]|nr:hypothetical protein GGR56DRAFT_525582 [Xylariaceae sp. FL0804]
MAPLCRFYQQGNCRNGAHCRFEHPGANSNNSSYGSNANNSNRFGALSSGAPKSQDSSAGRFKVNSDGLKLDLAEERPTWILSCYGPGRDAPKQLFGGYPREQSLEEIMLHIRSAADQQQAMAEVTGLYQQAEQQIQTTLSNVAGAVDFVLAGENERPNRLDICEQNTTPGGTNGVFAKGAAGQNGFSSNPLASNPSANQNPFSTTSQANPFGGGSAPAFGQPSALGQKPNPFGAPSQTPAFGQPSQMGAAAPAPAFGQPSAMGAAGPAFGQPSQMGSSAPAFGQPSQMGSSGPAFGQPSTMGQKPNPFAAASSAPPSGFGQAAQPAFGQPSALGQKPNPFAAASNAASNAPSSNPFGQPATAPAPSPFGTPAASNPFATASNDQPMDTSAPTPTAASNPFGQPTTSGFNSQAGNAFGVQPSGAAAAPANPFGQAQAPTAAPNATTAQKGSPFPPGSTKQHPAPETYINKAMNGQIASFAGQPVAYKFKVNDKYLDHPPPGSRGVPAPGVRNPDGTWRKIFFPDGPPSYNKDTEPDPAQYGAATKAAYENMTALGRFEGDMPEVPPMREDCVWNF